jgi:hypothetical protein
MVPFGFDITNLLCELLRQPDRPGREELTGSRIRGQRDR